MCIRDSKEGLFGYIFGSDSYSGSFEIKSGLSAEDYISPELCFTFYVPQGLKKVTVLDGDVFDGAFMNMRTLTEVVFADDADTTYIGEAAFMGATALEGFTVPAGVSIVGDYAFCFSGVRTVDMSAADEITVLPEYILSLIHICQYVFTLREDNTTYAIAENAANKPSAAEVTLPLKVGPYDVTAVARRGFTSSSFTKLTIPEGYTDIVENAFYGNTSLVVVNFPSTLKAIDANAFLDASSLTVVWFSEGLETIGINAFSGANLPFVILPASLKLIESGAFDVRQPAEDTTVLEEVLFMGSVAPNIEKGAFGDERRDYLCAGDALDAYKTALTASETGGSLYEFDDTRLDFQGRYTCLLYTSITVVEYVARALCQISSSSLCVG